MTTTREERDQLFGDLQSVASRTGGAVSRELFETACDFAAARDPAAMKTLTEIYKTVTLELSKRTNGKEQPCSKHH